MGMPTNEYDPYEHAHRLGIQIGYQRLRTGNGLWVPDHRLIILQPRLRRIEERSVLTHEMAHVCLGHRDTTPRNELRADRWAVHKLIPPGALEEAALFSAEPGQWCHQLGVSADILDRALLDYRAA
jgi:Zn-dependent peptidase ImmA (M78 family)